jgi:hypothetical protein
LGGVVVGAVSGDAPKQNMKLFVLMEKISVIVLVRQNMKKL